MRVAGCFPAEAEAGKGKLRKEGKSGGRAAAGGRQRAAGRAGKAGGEGTECATGPAGSHRPR